MNSLQNPPQNVVCKCNICGNTLKKTVRSECFGTLFCYDCLMKGSLAEENYYYCFPEIDQITNKIFLGNAETQERKDLLNALKVTHIIVAAKGLKANHPKDFTYLQLDVDDYEMENISKHFETAYKFIEECKSAVYVHCLAGISRSPSIVISYLMRKEGMTFEDARKFVANKRAFISPNSGFVMQLKEYEEKLRKEGLLKKVDGNNEEQL